MAYVTVSEARDFIGITGSTYDAFLTTTLDFCSELADTWSGRDWGDVSPGAGFNTHSVTEVLNFHQRTFSVTLREAPIISVQSVEANDATLLSTEFSVEIRTGILKFLDSQGYPYPYGTRMTVTYVAGYAAVPAPLNMFVLRGTSYIFNRRDAEGVSSDLVADTQVTFRPMELRAIYEETMGALSVDLMGIT